MLIMVRRGRMRMDNNNIVMLFMVGLEEERSGGGKGEDFGR
jgi:hypothetical protein